MITSRICVKPKRIFLVVLLSVIFLYFVLSLGLICQRKNAEMLLKRGVFQHLSTGRYNGHLKTDRHKIMESGKSALAVTTMQHGMNLSDVCKVCSLYNLKGESFDDSKCYRVRNPSKVQICVHKDTEDVYISKDLRRFGVWEQETVRSFQQSLSGDRDLDVIDIGANLGLYSLIAAAMGRKVLSVEPLNDNVLHFHKSVKINRFDDRITLITNAVSNKREKVYFKTYNDNKGGTSMWEGKKACQDRKCPSAWSIYMDDLLPLLIKRNITKAVMKIDIEGAEHLALAAASRMFSTINIPVIYMEFTVQKQFCGLDVPESEDKRLTRQMFLFLKKQGFTRVYRKGFTQKLDPDSCSDKWPKDVIWVHKSQTMRRRNTTL